MAGTGRRTISSSDNKAVLLTAAGRPFVGPEVGAQPCAGNGRAHTVVQMPMHFACRQRVVQAMGGAQTRAQDSSMQEGL